jgi:hypothetical protein
MKRLPYYFFPCLFATLAIGIVWLFKGPTDQELLANVAKAMDFHPWSGWWSASFLGGASQAPGLTTLLTYLVLKAFILPFGVMLGSKLASLLAVFLGGLGVSALLRRWTGDGTAAWVGGVAYILGPQMALRLAGNEHLPVVFSMIVAPWVLWALIGLARQPSWQNSLIVALLSAVMTLTFTKLAVAFAPLALLFVGYLWIRDLEGRKALLKGLLRSLVLFVPLAVIPLLPTLREVQWLAMFQFDPFAAWQQNFSLKSLVSWLDRGNALQKGMPPGFTADLGGFYVGVVSLAVGIFAWWRTSRNEAEDATAQSLLSVLKLVFGMLLFVSWMSAGPRCIAQGMLEFLKSASNAPDLTIPLFWLIAAGQCALLWMIWPDHPRRDWGRIAAILVFLGVPGFRLYELLPFAHDIRAPWSVWQVGGSLSVALLFGVGVALLLRGRLDGMLSSGGFAILLVILMGGDYSVYLRQYGAGALPGGTYPAFKQICAQLRQAPAGTVYPLSGRYFYLQIPALTGKPIEQEAFNSYFGLAWRRALQNASMASPDTMRTGLSLLGCSYIFIDKQDPNTPANLQQTFRALFPALMENEYFVVLANQGALYPAFLVHDFVALPKGSYAMAPAAVQLAPQNLITVEMAGVDRNASGFAGIAKGPNQIELLQQYQGKAGQPFARVPLTGNRMDDYQRMTYQLPPTASGWLVVTEAYHPDWTVTIDGKAAQVHRAEAALLSTYVPLGSHEVAFRFKAPAWYSLCLALGALSWIIALAALLYLPSKYAPAKWRELWVNRK